MSDRSPGATNVKYGQIVVGQAGVDLETLGKTVSVYEEGSYANCGPADAEVFGIDRGNTHDGYQADENLQENVKRFSASEDRLEVEYNGEDDFGPSTYFDDGDAFVSVAQCLDNPDEPGWYQLSGRTTGVTEDGERVTYGAKSHYFWICDCEDEAEAREQLGPPPSEPEPTPTPEATEGAEETNATETPAGAESTDDAEPDAEATADSEGDSAGDSDTGDDSPESETTAGTTDTPASTPPATAEATTTPTATPATDREWNDVVVETPTPGGGPGFGGPVALAALAAAGLFLRRRSSR
jgi:PGF-CTERM protein